MQINEFISKVDYLYITICSDVFSSAYVPGVSSPQPLGIEPEIALKLLKYILKSKKVISFDIAEISPRFDHDNQSSKLAALIIYALVNSLSDLKFSF